MTATSTTIKGGTYIYNINGTLDLSKSIKPSALVPTDTVTSNLIVNVGGVLSLGKNTIIGDVSALKGKVLLRVLAGGRVNAFADSILNIRGNVVFNMKDSSAMYRKIVSSIDTSYVIAASDTGNNSVILKNTGTVDTFTVKLRTGVSATWPTASASSLVNRQWTIQESVNGGSNLTVRLKWLTADQLSGFNPASPISVYVYTGDRWKEDTAIISGAGTVASPYMATISGVDSFRFFVIGARNLAVPVPFITQSGNLTAFVQGIGAPSQSQTLTIGGANLKGNITATPPANYELSVDNGTTWSASAVTIPQTNGNISGFTLMVRLNAANLGSYGGNIVLSSTGAASVSVPVTGTTVQPVVTSNGSLAPFSQNLGAPSASQSFSTSGTNLTGNVTVTPSFGYEVSVDNGTTWSATSATINQTSGAVTNASIMVRLNASLPGVYVGYIALTSSGAATIYVNVTGTTVATGITSFSKDVFSIYPNPATTVLNIRHLAAKEGTVIDIWQMDGKKVVTVAPVANSKETSIGIASLPAATYIVVISNGKEQYALRITKN